jgi:uncharacterized protein (TIGR01244 family)
MKIRRRTCGGLGVDAGAIMIVLASGMVAAQAGPEAQGKAGTPDTTPATSTAGTPSSTAASPTPLLPIPNARIPYPGVLSGGQPTREQVEAAARAGYRTVITLRAEGESGAEWEREAVEGLGMKFVRIPITGDADLTREKVTQLDAALEEAREGGMAILHCGSGNRVGALLALRSAWVEGTPPEGALKFGVASGMTGLKEKTQELLGLPASSPSAPK